MKLLFTQDALVNAGAERSHLEILFRFSEEVDVGFVYFYPKHDLKPEYERAGIRLFFLDIPEGYHFHLAVYRLVQVIRQEKPDLLISSLWRADIITRIASLITGVPLVGTLVNDSYAPIAWTDKKGLKYKMVYWLDRWTSGIPIHWIANAQALADSHVKTLGIKKDKISVVYRGRPVIAPARRGGSEGGAKQSLSENKYPDEEIASPDSTGIAMTFPDETASPADGFEINSYFPKSSHGVTRHFISYGRLLERKGFQDAIKAFSQVLETYPDCTLTIFGEGPYRSQLETLIQNLGMNDSVFLPGKISNPMDLLSSKGKQHPRSDIPHPTSFHYFIFPSWYEGFSGALVEAMMAGIPIIASDIPMNLEAVSDQESALVFPVQQVQILAQLMCWAIEHPEEMAILDRNAKKTAEDRFDIEKIAKKYESVLVNLLMPKIQQ